MKYASRNLKGTYGYIRKQLVFEIFKTVLLFAMAFGLFFIGYLTLHTKKSLWSILAVLALLPASKSLVGVIMLARFKSLKEDEYERYHKALGDIPALYENILTTRERTFFVPVLCYAAGSVIAFAPGGDVKSVKEHLDTVLKAAGHTAVVKIYDREEDFIGRAFQITPHPEDTNRAASIFNTIKAVSL